MRTIKFRGKRTDNEEWVYGDLLRRYGMTEIYQPSGTIPIIPESVGQFTGLKDKNGVKIYEGDIMQVNQTEFNIGGKHEVYYYEDGFVTSSVNFINKEKANKNCLNYQIRSKGAYVIGNIHDNPKILNEL